MGLRGYYLLSFFFSVLVDGSSSLPVPGMVTAWMNRAVLSHWFSRGSEGNCFDTFCSLRFETCVSFTPSNLLNKVRSSVFSLVLVSQKKSSPICCAPGRVSKYDEMCFPSMVGGLEHFLFSQLTFIFCRGVCPTTNQINDRCCGLDDFPRASGGKLPSVQSHADVVRGRIRSMLTTKIAAVLTSNNG